MRRFNGSTRDPSQRSIRYAHGIRHDTATSTFTSEFVRVLQMAVVSAAARRDPASPGTRGRWTASSHGSRSRTRDGRKFVTRLKNWDETLSERLDADKLVFAQRRNCLQMNSLQRRPKFGLIPAAAALPGNSQPGGISRKEGSTRRTMRDPPCAAQSLKWSRYASACGKH